MPLFFLTGTSWTYFWFLMGHNDGRYQALASRLPDRAKLARPLPKTSSFLLLALLTQFFTGRNLTEIFERPGPGYDNGLLYQTFYQLYTVCAIVITASLYDRFHRSFRKSEVGSRKTLLGFRRNTIAWWFDPSRSYFDSGAIKGGHTINCKIKLQSKSLFSVLCLFRMFFWFFFKNGFEIF